MSVEEKIVTLLESKGYHITTAESCTGGLLAGRLLDVAGASTVFNEGYITYANEAKERLVGVSHDTLSQYGAVSHQTAAEMALGACNVSGAEVALSTTGIAGPGGGSKEKPVGLIYIGCAVKGDVKVKECRFDGDRTANRKGAVEEALQFLYQILSNS